MIICILALIAGIAIVYALKVYEISFTNNFKTGSVDVKIEQYEITENGEKLIDPGVVMPNQDVSYIPRITNLRSSGYVRVKVDIVMDKEIPRPITLDDVYDINEDWVQKGEYFYCTKVLKTNESSDIFEGFHVPAEWTQETASGFRINARVDVVQDDNFTPDFDSIAPWGNLEIEQAKEEDNIVYGVAKQIGPSPKWQYTADRGLESEFTDLFANFDHYMAGDVYKDTLEMQNKSNTDIKVYFRTQTVSDDFLKQMQLKITCNGKKVYEGDLVSKPLYKYEELTTIKARDSQDFNFEVKLPEESKNYYSVLKDKVIWKFKVAEIEVPNDGAAKTGDNSNLLPFMIIAVIAMLGMLVVYATRRKDKKNE